MRNISSGASYSGASYSGASYSDESSIAAFATTPGNSALTIIRCTGKGSIELAAKVFSPDSKLLRAEGNTVVHGWIVSADGKNKQVLVDEVLVSVFRAPKSYTGEDSLDISCHGGPAAGKAVMDALKSAGFRDALPGEFTFRAFINGKLDLTRCESVMELVSAKTDESRRNAVSRLSGSLFNEINDIKKQLVQVLAGAEIFLDYSEDEITAEADEVAGMLPNREIAYTALERLKKLSASWQMERLYQEGVTVVIAGRPNAGKSSLFNSFLKEDRSIVTDIPGATRDWIEAWISIEGIPIRLVDTAGLRETVDSVEKIGVERARELINEAHLVLYLIDGAQGLTDEDREFISEYVAQSKQCLVLWNKADIAKFNHGENSYYILPVSSKTGEGLAELTTAIATALLAPLETSAIGTAAEGKVGTARQKKLVDVACAVLEEALPMAEREEPLDLIAPLLREAVNALGEITGEVSSADILNEMFSRFCVGK
ncbi:MAG: tRNA uridine-5-carboxymethylaminomethyl(34) synthesis GTPase MnmE [Treponema sp.]|jgi:tRNA modification GTPase|nr:tRNA uridine-5-carboxymethylaminomethyl(34) synthesis GTPase MnmE [Treponema sp.]